MILHSSLHRQCCLPGMPSHDPLHCWTPLHFHFRGSFWAQPDGVSYLLLCLPCCGRDLLDPQPGSSLPSLPCGEVGQGSGSSQWNVGKGGTGFLGEALKGPMQPFTTPLSCSLVDTQERTPRRPGPCNDPWSRSPCQCVDRGMSCEAMEMLGLLVGAAGTECPD